MKIFIFLLILNALSLEIFAGENEQNPNSKCDISLSNSPAIVKIDPQIQSAFDTKNEVTVTKKNDVIIRETLIVEISF